MEFEIYQINTFTKSYKGGNPAGVCPLDEWIDDDLMQDIAKENGFSETAFFVPKEGRYDLRWFTPGCEVDLCGHATLASAFVLSKHKGVSKKNLEFQTKSGLLNVLVSGDTFALDMPTNNYKEVECPNCIVSALGKKPIQTYLADDYLVVFDDDEFVSKVVPDFSELQKVKARGTIITAESSQTGIDFVSRWFGGPDVGVNEDPVTGSAHRTLIPYWSDKLGKDEMNALQCSSRGGELGCTFRGNRVEVRGYITLLLFVTYLLSSYLAFWVEVEWAFILHLCLPVAILSSVVIFGTNLKDKFDISIRTISGLSLILGLGFAYKSICCSGEQGGIGVMFIGVPVLFFTFLVYCILWSVQILKRT